MIEKKIHVIVFPIKNKMLLSCQECEVRSHFQNKPFKFGKYGILQIFFAVGILEPQKIQYIRIAIEQIQ